MLGRVVLLFVLILVNGFFSCAEIAVLQVGEAKVKKLSEEGNKKAKKLLQFTEEPSRFLSTIQVAITMAGFLSSAFAAESFAGLLDALALRFLPSFSICVLPISFVLITLVLSYISIVFGELVPKRLAQVHTEAIALNIASILGFVSLISTPLVFLLSASTNAILRLIGIDPDEDATRISEEDILLMVDEGMEKGTIESSENEFIQNVFEFKDLIVEESAPIERMWQCFI